MALKIQGTTVIDDSRNITNVSQFNGYTPASESTSISAGSGLTGGGNLSSNVSLGVDFATAQEVSDGNSTTTVVSPSTLSTVVPSQTASIANALLL